MDSLFQLAHEKLNGDCSIESLVDNDAAILDVQNHMLQLSLKQYASDVAGSPFSDFVISDGCLVPSDLIRKTGRNMLSFPLSEGLSQR